MLTNELFQRTVGRDDRCEDCCCGCGLACNVANPSPSPRKGLKRDWMEVEMKPHYFEQSEADKDDFQLGMAKMQGYVPQTCLLGGIVVMYEVTAGRNPCWGCAGPRERCNGKPQAQP